MGSTLPAESTHFDPTLADLQALAAISSGAALLVLGANRRLLPRVAFTVAGMSLVYRGLTRTWPEMGLLDMEEDATRAALAGDRGVHVREAVQVERPIEAAYHFWRSLENLPRFMSHLESVADLGGGRSRWVARGPAGVRVAWEAEIVNEVENQVIGWRSLPGSDVLSAGSVNFDRVRAGRSTRITVHLQYDPPAGGAGAAVARLLGGEPSQTIREDLRRLKQVLEADEIARAGMTRSGR